MSCCRKMYYGNRLQKTKRSDYFSGSMEFVIIHLLLHSFLLKNVAQAIVKALMDGLQLFIYLGLAMEGKRDSIIFAVQAIKSFSFVVSCSHSPLFLLQIRSCPLTASSGRKQRFPGWPGIHPEQHNSQSTLLNECWIQIKIFNLCRIKIGMWIIGERISISKNGVFLHKIYN